MYTLIPNDRHLDAESERNEQWQEQRTARIESAAKDLMHRGEECDPYGVNTITGSDGKKYTYHNLFEAFNELKESDQTEVSELLYAAKLGGIQGTWPVETVFLKMDEMVNAYWLKQAMAIAERNDRG